MPVDISMLLCLLTTMLIDRSILLDMCPHTTRYVSSFYYICVLILLCVVILLYGNDGEL